MRKSLGIFSAAAVLAAISQNAGAYIDLAPTLSKVMIDARRIAAIEVTAVDVENRTVTYKETTLIKGFTGEPETGTLTMFENKSIPAQLSQWARPGARALFLTNGNQAILSIGQEWYAARMSTAANAVNKWKLYTVRPDLPLSFYGPVARLIEAAQTMQAGKDALITVVAYGADNEGATFELALNRPNLPGQVRVQRIRARLAMPAMVMAASANPAYFVGEGWAGTDDIPKLIENLKSASAATRQQAAEDLAWLGRKAAAAESKLEPLLKDEAPGVRFAAARALLRIKAKPDASLKVLADGLASKESALVCDAVRNIGLSGLDKTAAAQFTPALSALLKSDNGAVKYFALQTVSTLGPAAAACADAVIPLLDDAALAMDAADALGRIGPAASAALPRLAKMLESTDEAVRWAAVRGMSQIGGEDSKPAAVFMAKLLNTEFSEVDGYNMMVYLAMMGPAAKVAAPAVQAARIKNPVLPTATLWAMEPDKSFPWIPGSTPGAFRGGPMLMGNGDGPEFAKLIYENYVHELGPRLSGAAKVLAAKILDGTGGNVPEWGWKILSCSPEAAESCVQIFEPALESDQLVQRERAAVALGYMAGHAAAAKAKLEAAIAKTTDQREKRLLQWSLREIQKPIED